jgi:hypothetical protein
MSPELNRDQRMTLRTKLFPPAGLLLIVLLLSACGESKKQASSPALIANLDGLEPGWNVIEPGGDTMCSLPYKPSRG